MALAKLSLPGWVNLSAFNPAIESTMLYQDVDAGYTYLCNNIFFGNPGICHSSSLGSTEVGLEVSSCACAASTDTTAVIIIAQIRVKSLHGCLFKSV